MSDQNVSRHPVKTGNPGARPSITCPVCGRTSWHPTDVAEGWCGACHGATSRPLPEGCGLRWVMLRGGSIDAGRLLEEPLPDRYEIVATGEVYVRQGEEFVREAA